MPTRVYNEKHRQWVRDNFLKHKNSILLSDAFSLEFNTEMTPIKMKGLCKMLGLRRNNQNKYTKEQKEWLKKNHETKSFTQLVKDFNSKFNCNVTSGAISQQCRTYLGLKYENPEKFNNKIAWNKKDLYSERVTKRGEVHIKNEKGVWVNKGRYVYEQEFGDLDEDCQVIHLDGDRLNCNIENLKSVPLKYMPMLNRNKWLGKGEISKTALLLCELKYQNKKIMG